jgi:glycosyltransferase involved in cell wall biosynthesis
MALVAPAFKDETVVLFSCNIKVRVFAKIISMKTGLTIRTYPKNALSESEMIELFSRSRIYVGISLTDGVSTSSLEAMSVGAFPIQSDSSCSSEWFLSGQTGHSFDSFDPEALSLVITRYYWDLALLSNAAESNIRHVESRRISMQNSRPHELFYRLGKEGSGSE